MGLIKAAFSSVGSVFSDQWKEYFQIDSMSNDELVVRAKKITKGNNKGGDDIISNGSVVAVADGQVALIVEDGKIIEFCAEPGRFVWDSSSEPSMLCGEFFKGMIDSFKKMGERFTFGGDRAKKQYVYFVNTKEIIDNKFGTTTPMVYDDRYYGTALYIRYFGQFSFRIKDPILFFTSIAGNVSDKYNKEMLMSFCREEFMTALDTSLSMLSVDGIKFSQIPQKQREIAKYMSETLDEEWGQRRGMDIVSVAISKVTPDEKSRARIEEFDTNLMHSNPGAMAGGLAYAQMQAMQNAAKNSGGAVNGFMGLGMMNGFSGNNAGSQQTLINTAKQLQNDTAPAAPTQNDTWKCTCGAENSGKFCAECGNKKPEKLEWRCSCGAVNTGKFCSECGAKKVTDFICTCGYKSKTAFKFCPECGSKQA